MVSEALGGLFRSLRVYHGDTQRMAAMQDLYRRFVPRDALVFDIGAHVGDRVTAFRRLGARVIALEPQPLPARALRLIHGRDRDVRLVEAAVGARRGTLSFHLNSANPTVSTASEVFIERADGADGWEGQNWDRTISVPVMTLDDLIADFGLPAFAKIDVEGFEAQVLDGLTQPIPALSFEFTTIDREVAYCCLALLNTLGDYRYDIALGESQALEFGAGNEINGPEMAEYIRALPHAANSGDVYAVLKS